MSNILGKTIKIERTKQELSSMELAEKLNISRQTLSALENGRTLPGAELLARLDNAFPKANIFEKYKKTIKI